MSAIGSNSARLNFTGLATGIDSAKIIEGLTAINQRRIDTLRSQQNSIVDRQTTIATLQGRLFEFQSTSTRLGRSLAGAFDSKKATSSDDTILTANATSSALAGNYTLSVEKLAQANQIASQGYSDQNVQIQEGTLDLTVGGKTTTVTIDSGNNSLRGLADAINAAGSDVRASIINDGSANPYRLVITSNTTGNKGQITVGNNLNSGTGVAINPSATTLQTGQDAEVILGQGAGAITVKSGTNTFNSLIPGVTINVSQVDSGRQIGLSVTNDVEGGADAVKKFVDSFNAVIDYVDEQDDYNPETQTAGKLLGVREVSELQADITAALTSAIGGLPTSANRLSVVGITFNDRGRLQLDSGKLNQALRGELEGVSPGDVKRLFGLTGSTSDPGISFQLGGPKTRPSGANPYQAQVISPATRATATATNALAASTLIDSSNNSLILKLNNFTSTSITISDGNYSRNDLVTVLQNQINANASLNGNLITVDLDNDRLRFTSQTFGSTSNISFESGSAFASLGLVGSETGRGASVAGQFIVNGQIEAAIGSGQLLTGDPDSLNTAGLQVRATTSVPQTVDVTVTQGFASRINEVLNQYLDPIEGRFKLFNDGLNSNIQDIDKSIARQNTTLTTQQESLARQFAAMESAVNELKGLGDRLNSLIPRVNFS